MEASEKAPLLRRPDYSAVTQVGADPVVVQCCGLESSRLGRVPVIRTLFKKKEPNEKVFVETIMQPLKCVMLFFPHRVHFLPPLRCCCLCWAQW